VTLTHGGKTMSKFTEVLSTRQHLPAQDRVKNALDKESYEDFMEAMNNPAISAAAIGRALKDLGVEVSTMSLQRWRQK
jgi:uncharacterized protein (DUF1778 family)